MTKLAEKLSARVSETEHYGDALNKARTECCVVQQQLAKLETELRMREDEIKIREKSLKVRLLSSVHSLLNKMFTGLLKKILFINEETEQETKMIYRALNNDTDSMYYIREL